MLSGEEEWFDVAFEEVLGDTTGDGFAVVVQGFDVGVAELCGDLESDVQELADVWIVGRIRLVVAECSGELLAGPTIHGFGGGEFCEIDVDDGGVGLAKGFLFGKCLGVDFLR